MIDADGSGSVTFRELNKTLRKPALLDPSPQPGVASSADGNRTNKSPLRKRSGAAGKSASFTLGDVDGDGDGHVDSEELMSALKVALNTYGYSLHTYGHSPCLTCGMCLRARWHSRRTRRASSTCSRSGTRTAMAT